MNGKKFRRRIFDGPRRKEPHGKSRTAAHVQELAVSENLPLIGWLFEEASRRGLDIRALANELGVTYGYIAQLKNGVRSARAISEDFSEACARFLKVPRVAIMMLSGQLRVEDYYATADTIESELNNALDSIRKDPDWSVWLPKSIGKADFATKQMIVIAYEQATSKVLLATRVDVQQLSEALEELAF